MIACQEREALTETTMAELLALALEAFERAEQTYIVETRIGVCVWCQWRESRWVVDLPGAVMLFVLRAPERSSLCRKPSSYDYDTYDALRALGELQYGGVGEACWLLRGATPEGAWALDRDVPDYGADRSGWWREMRALLADLQEAAL